MRKKVHRRKTSIRKIRKDLTGKNVTLLLLESINFFFLTLFFFFLPVFSFQINKPQHNGNTVVDREDHNDDDDDDDNNEDNVRDKSSGKRYKPKPCPFLFFRC